MVQDFIIYFFYLEKTREHNHLVPKMCYTTLEYFSCKQVEYEKSFENILDVKFLTMSYFNLDSIENR